MSRILIWSPNYAPELTGIPPLVTDAAEWLAGRGHEVDVVTAMPNYPSRRIEQTYRGALWHSERLGPVAVHRSWLWVRPEEGFRDKALYELSFTACSLPQVVAHLRRCEVILCVIPCLSAAASAAALVRALGRRAPRLVLWVQDLVLRAATTVRGLGLGARRLLASVAFLEGAAARGADHVVVCSPGFEQHFRQRGVDPRRLETILNWVDVDWIVPEPPPPDNGRPTRFLYSGNLGYTQRFETAFEALRLTRRAVELELVGDGNAAGHVRALALHAAGVRVRPPVPREDFPALLGSAHAHLLLQRRESAGANFPSKIGPYLASGRPVVASLDPATPAACLLEESGGAVLVPPEDPAALAAAIDRLAGDPVLRARLGDRGRAYATSRLDRRTGLRALESAVLGGR